MRAGEFLIDQGPQRCAFDHGVHQGGDELSFLDLVCLVAAIPATIVHKTTTGSAPFVADDSVTRALLAADSTAQVQAAFVVAPSAAAAPSADVLSTESSPTEVLDEDELKVFGFASGFFALAGSVVLVYTSAVQRTLDAVGLDNAYPKTLGLISAVGNVAYVAPNIASLLNAAADNRYATLNNALTGVSVVKGFVNIAANTSAAASRFSAGVESAINLAWNIPVIANIAVNADRWDSTYESLIPESAGNFAFNCGGILELPISVLRDVEAKAITSGVQHGLMVLYGLCMPIAGGGSTSSATASTMPEP